MAHHFGPFLRLLFIYGLLATGSGQISTANFFPYGTTAGDTTLATGDDTFALVPLQQPFKFFGQTYNELYVNVNGAISFKFGVAQYTPTCGSLLNNSMIAPFWADVDTRAAGNIYFRESTNPTLRNRLADEVQQHFNMLLRPTISSLFIATWDAVPFYNCNGDPVPPSGPRNTFQLVIGTSPPPLGLGPVKSYAMFLYNNTEWTTGGASGGNCTTGLGGVPAKAGFDQGDGIFFGLPGSCTADVVDIETTSNTGVNGKWIFKVDTSFQQACPGSTNPIETILQLFANLITGGETTC